ncbi:MAG: hypothetical protein PHE51_04895 [Eubacteriales bacterium]|nr:hypothetical protein [Eubacteriales bacterium]
MSTTVTLTTAQRNKLNSMFPESQSISLGTKLGYLFDQLGTSDEDGIVLSGAGSTGIGISIPATVAATNSILIGTSSSAAGGMPITATKNKQIVCYGEILEGEITNTSNLRCQWNRLRISANADISGGGQVTAMQATTMIYGSESTTSLGTWATSGLWGSVGMDTAVINLGSGAYLAGVVAQIAAGAGYTGASGSYTSGLYVIGNSDTASTMTGDYSGILIENQGAKAFTNGINILGTGVTTAINIGAVTTGISMASTVTTGISMAGAVTTGVSITGGATTAFNTSGTFTGASGRAAKLAGTVNNANYGDGYSFVESELTLTGTCAGAVSAFGSWINVITGTTGANMVCAQTNGVYEEATGVLTNTTVIFGMRMQSLLAEAPSESYPFSCVSNTNIITALFSCNAGSSDMGTVTNAGSDSGKLVPLYKETSTGTTYYVKLYSLA